MMIVEYSWVINVLESCKTNDQIKTSENLFKLFLKKWEDEISDIKKIQFVNNFEKLVKHRKFMLKTL